MQSHDRPPAEAISPTYFKLVNLAVGFLPNIRVERNTNRTPAQQYTHARLSIYEAI